MGASNTREPEIVAADLDSDVKTQRPTEEGVADVKPRVLTAGRISGVKRKALVAILSSDANIEGVATEQTQIEESNKVTLETEEGTILANKEIIADLSPVLAVAVTDCVEGTIPVQIDLKTLRVVLEFMNVLFEQKLYDSNVITDEEGVALNCLFSEKSPKETKPYFQTIYKEMFLAVDCLPLCKLLKAADYLNCKPLMDLCESELKKKLGECSSPAEVRQKFIIKDDLTSEEAAAINAEVFWAFAEKCSAETLTLIPA
eukprot:jgi/Botrbrau1/6882/Bobra.67_3s0003.1